MDQRVSNSTRDGQTLVTRELKWWTWKRVLVQNEQKQRNQR